MKKRLFGFALSICLLLGLLVGSALAAQPEGTDTIAVPEEAMVIKNGTYYGISREWFAAQNPEKETLSLTLEIPDSVTAVGMNGFLDSYTSEKKTYGAVTSNDNLGRYNVVEVDFSQAVNLTTIGTQAAMGGMLTGVLDLSHTQVAFLGKNAFKGCSGLTGVILPQTLKKIGDADGGTVFRDCTGLKFVRTAGQNPNAVFDLPQGLESIGKHSFYGCTGLPENTTVTIPEGVTYVGSEVFHYTPAVTTIVVKAQDASGYDGAAFKTSGSYGLGKRLTVFGNAAAKNSFTPSGSSTYANSLTYEFTLHYGTDGVTEPKLYGQAVNVCKDAQGVWAVNADYRIPEAPSTEAPVGYDCSWAYNGKILTAKTVLKPAGDDLYLDMGLVLQNPTVTLLVDGKTVSSEDTYPKLNLSNDKTHTIGVEVSHPIQGVENADAAVKFEYEWTDVWNGGKEGPRMEEPGFGRYNLFDNPEVTNTITISGPEHERTSAGNYSGTDYGDGYYLLEIYGYYKSRDEAQWKLFYKSASTVIGADPDRTVNTAYLFDVVTSDPAEKPQATLENLSVTYGYDQAALTAALEPQPGHTYTCQWYQAEAAGQISGGEAIPGAREAALTLPTGLDAGNYHYYLEVTAQKTENRDETTLAVPVTFTVRPQTVLVTPGANQGKYTGQQDGSFAYTLSQDIAVTGALSREPGEAAGSYGFTLGPLTPVSGNYALELTQEVSYTIFQYMAEAAFSPAEPENGVYTTAVTVTPPAGHAMSIDGGKTWSEAPLVLEEYDGEFSYLLRSLREDETKDAIAANSRYLKIQIPEKPEIPQTGEGDQVILLAALLLLSAAGLTWAGVFGRKKPDHR